MYTETINTGLTQEECLKRIREVAGDDIVSEEKGRDGVITVTIEPERSK